MDLHEFMNFEHFITPSYTIIKLANINSESDRSKIPNKQNVHLSTWTSLSDALLEFVSTALYVVNMVGGHLGRKIVYVITKFTL